MQEKISNEQLEDLLEELEKHQIPIIMILKLCNIEKMKELSAVQYNELLYIIRN